MELLSSELFPFDRRPLLSLFPTTTMSCSLGASQQLKQGSSYQVSHFYKPHPYFTCMRKKYSMYYMMLAIWLPDDYYTKISDKNNQIQIS
jgi:hypothetical protein